MEAHDCYWTSYINTTVANTRQVTSIVKGMLEEPNWSPASPPETQGQGGKVQASREI